MILKVLNKINQAMDDNTFSEDDLSKKICSIEDSLVITMVVVESDVEHN